MNGSRLAIGAVVAAMLFVGCSKESGEVAPTIGSFRTYELVPIGAQALPGGSMVICKRAPGDHSAAYVQFLNTSGDPTTRIDFAQLPRKIENITFRMEDIVITDVRPWNEGTYLLAGFATQPDLQDRIHAIAYRVDARGSEVAPPLRRFLGAGSELVTTNDINELHRTKVLAARSAEGDLLLATRYETASAAHMQLMRIPVTAQSTARTIDLTPSSRSTRLHGLFVRPNGDILVCHDVQNSGQTTLRVAGYRSEGSELYNTEEVTLAVNTPHLTGVVEVDGILRLTGTYDHGNNEPRVFHAAGADLGSLGEVHHTSAGSGRAATSYGSGVVGGAHWCLVNTFETGIIDPEAERDDRISDLQLVRFDVNGGILEEKDVLIGHGIRGLTCFQSPNSIAVIGSLHPFLNTDYLHGAYVAVEP